jgi:glycogen operon protein
MLSIGTPMLLMGDELRRSQRGNNNAYCQDNEISWLDWGLQKRHSEIYRFAKMMMHFARAVMS